MRELGGFLLAAALAIAGITGLVLVQRGGDSDADPSEPLSAPEPATAAAAAPSTGSRDPHVIILIRPDQSATLPSLYPHVPTEMLDRASAQVFDSGIPLETIRETTFYLTSGMVSFDFVDLRDR
jgi:hypothetical protein